jgi:hypothetical protein
MTHLIDEILSFDNFLGIRRVIVMREKTLIGNHAQEKKEHLPTKI